jgi:hypothetical protein
VQLHSKGPPQCSEQLYAHKSKSPPGQWHKKPPKSKFSEPEHTVNNDERGTADYPASEGSSHDLFHFLSDLCTTTHLNNFIYIPSESFTF